MLKSLAKLSNNLGRLRVKIGDVQLQYEKQFIFEWLNKKLTVCIWTA